VPHLSNCPECGASFGDPHWPRCGQIAVDETEAPPRDHLLVQSADAIREGRRRGWAVAHVPGEGFRPCRPGEPGSSVDLDRAAYWLTHGDAVLYGNDEPAPPAGG
jgi:hypothetical protein